jgi:hypothetical protein
MMAIVALIAVVLVILVVGLTVGRSGLDAGSGGQTAPFELLPLPTGAATSTSE